MGEGGFCTWIKERVRGDMKVGLTWVKGGERNE